MIIDLDLYAIERECVGPFYTFEENVIDSGCYYLSPEICKDIIITSGVSGIHTSSAVKKMRKNIGHVREVMEDAIPAFRYMNGNIILSYAGELAECLVGAADIGKGVEVVMGYPKILVFKIS